MLGPEERQGHEDGPRPNLVELATISAPM